MDLLYGFQDLSAITETYLNLFRCIVDLYRFFMNSYRFLIDLFKYTMDLYQEYLMILLHMKQWGVFGIITKGHNELTPHKRFLKKLCMSNGESWE